MCLKYHKINFYLYHNIWILLVITSYSISLTSQRMPNVGAENWLGGNLSIKINNHWEFNLENQFRYSIDNIDFDRNFTEFQIQESVNNQFIWGVSYGYIIKNNDFENMFNYNRYNLFSSPKTLLSAQIEDSI